MSGHAPGPWSHGRPGPFGKVHVCLRTEGMGPMAIAEVHQSHREYQATANARLIAAAPELLEALRPFANYACDPPCGCHNCIAREVIAKAEGGAS